MGKGYLILFVTGFLTILSAKAQQPMANFKLDGNFNDSSGNKHTLQPLSQGQLFSQLKGGASCLGPNSDKQLELGAVSKDIPSDISTGMTLSGYVRKPGGNSYGGTIFGFESAQDKQLGLFVGISYGFLNCKAGTKNYRDTERRLSDGKWHYIAMTIPPKDAGTEFALYFDGEKIMGGGIERFTNYGDFSLATIKPASGSDVQHMQFQTDDVKIFRRNLSESEIRKEAALSPKDSEEPIKK